MSVDRLNLLPSKGPQSLLLYIHEIAVVVVILCVISSAIGFLSVKLYQSKESNSLEHIQAENKRVSDRLEKLELDANESKLQERKLAYIKGVFENSVEWSKMLKELSLITPKNVWLTEFVSDFSEGKKIVIRGESYSQEGVTKFYHSLSRSLLLNKSQFNFSEKISTSDPKVFRFEIECILGSS